MRSVPFLVFLTLTGCGVTGVDARIYGGYIETQLTGNLALEPSAGGVSLDTLNVDVEESLGLTESSGSPYGRLDLELGPARVTLSAFQYSESGSGTLNADFGDIVVGTTVNSSLDLLNIKGALTFDLLDFGVFRLSPGIGLDFFDVDMTVRAPSVGQTEEISSLAPVPMLFAQGEVEVGPFAAIVDGGWISVDLDEGDGEYWDVEGLLRLTPGAGVEIFGGYRWISIDVQGNDEGQEFAADLELQGWFVGGGLRF